MLSDSPGLVLVLFHIVIFLPPAATGSIDAGGSSESSEACCLHAKVVSASLFQAGNYRAMHTRTAGAGESMAAAVSAPNDETTSLLARQRGEYDRMLTEQANKTRVIQEASQSIVDQIQVEDAAQIAMLDDIKELAGKNQRLQDANKVYGGMLQKAQSFAVAAGHDLDDRTRLKATPVEENITPLTVDALLADLKLPNPQPSVQPGFGPALLQIPGGSGFGPASAYTYMPAAAQQLNQAAAATAPASAAAAAAAGDAPAYASPYPVQFVNSVAPSLPGGAGAPVAWQYLYQAGAPITAQAPSESTFSRGAHAFHPPALLDTTPLLRDVAGPAASENLPAAAPVAAPPVTEAASPYAARAAAAAPGFGLSSAQLTAPSGDAVRDAIQTALGAYPNQAQGAQGTFASAGAPSRESLVEDVMASLQEVRRAQLEGQKVLQAKFQAVAAEQEKEYAQAVQEMLKLNDTLTERRRSNIALAQAWAKLQQTHDALDGRLSEVMTGLSAANLEMRQANSIDPAKPTNVNASAEPRVPALGQRSLSQVASTIQGVLR